MALYFDDFVHWVYAFTCSTRFKISIVAIDHLFLQVAKSNKDCLNKGGHFCILNFEESSTHQITVIVTDNGLPSQQFTKNLTIHVRNVNDAPRQVSISNFTVYENQPVDTLIGHLTARDEDVGQILTFSLIGGDMSHFYIDGLADLKIKTNFSDYETKSEYKLLVSVIDNGANKLQVCDFKLIISMRVLLYK